MNAPAKSGGRGSSTLASRGDLPPRVRTLCEGLLRISRDWFSPAVEQALADVEATWFHQAERAGNSADQQRHFEALRVFKESRALIAPRFLRSVEAGIASIRGGSPQHPSQAATTTRAPLELVDSASLEEDLALREVSARAEMRASQALHVFAYRFAVIAATPPEHESLPLGPTALAGALSDAFRGIDLDIEHRVLAYRAFDRFAFGDLARFYESINQWLRQERVLPNFHLTYRAPATGAARTSTPASAAKETAQKETAQEPATQPSPAAHAASGASSAATQAPMHATPAPSSANVAETPQFSTLRNLLAARRRADGEGAPATAHAPAIARDDLQHLLATMQRAEPAGAAGKRYDSQRFHNTLAVKLRRAGDKGSALALGGEEQDTVELIGMLFDYVTRNIKQESQARSLVGQLHVPVLRVALADKTFFTRRDHPARELINTIADAGERWLDDSEADPELAAKMRVVVDQLCTSYDGDVSVFEGTAHDLNQHLKLLARRADAAERRHVEAAKGRDRLDLARETARAAITGLLKNRSPSQRLRTLLEDTWTDALALAALRGGSDGAEFMDCLDIAAQLVARGDKPFGDAPGDDKLRQGAADHLRAVGLHDDEIGGLLDNLFVEAPTDAALAQLKRIDEALRAKPRLGGESPKRQPKPAPILDDVARKMLDQILHTPFGTWFEFVKNQQGETVRRKLAWYSPMTGNCLFVNQRGARIEDLTLELLACEMARGQARVASTERPRFVDRAWKTIVDLLRPRQAPAQEALA